MRATVLVHLVVSAGSGECGSLLSLTAGLTWDLHPYTTVGDVLVHDFGREI